MILLASCERQSPTIPNGDFESMDTLAYSIPTHALETSNPQSYVMCGSIFNCLRVGDAYHGRYAIKLITVRGMKDNCAGYFSNCHLNGHAPTWLGGVPYDQRPTGLNVYYKSDIAIGDSALILINFKKGGKSLGYYPLKLYGKHNTYTHISFPFDPPLKTDPDTVMFAAVSSDLTDSLAVSIPGSWIQLDDISFIGVKKQPDMFDGDFEQWENRIYVTPRYWIFQSGQGEGVSLTSDAYRGSHALELTTFLGDENGKPVSNPGSVENGSWNKKIEHLSSGFPFHGMQDTLVFYYKYTPVLSGDSALVYILFRGNGEDLQHIQTTLGASGIYRPRRVPINLKQRPDTAVIRILSSSWDSTGLNHIGSVLRIDDLHFTSSH